MSELERAYFAQETVKRAYDENSYSYKLKPYLKSFYMKFWEAMAAWYEAVVVSCPAGALYDAVMSRTGTEEFGITLIRWLLTW